MNCFYLLTNVSVRSNVIILLANVRKVCELFNLFYIKLVYKTVLYMCRMYAWLCMHTCVYSAILSINRVFLNLNFCLQHEHCVVGILKLKMLSQVN